MGKRVLNADKTLELEELTDLTVKILGMDKVSSVDVSGNAVEHYYDEQNNVCFDISKDMRISGNIICKIAF